jgi:hypothetical protein
LFVIATVAAVVAAALLPAVTGAGYLAGVADHPNQLAWSALAYLIAAAASVGIAIALYPLLKEVGSATALGSVVFRTIEAVFYTVAVVCLVSVLPIAQQVAAASGVDRGSSQALAESLLSIRDHSNLVAVLAFSLGALMYYILFYKSKLVPRWLSGWGIAGAALILVAALLSLFSNEPVTGYTPLILPIAVQEMVFAVWLLVKGFNPSVAARLAGFGADGDGERLEGRGPAMPEPLPR